ncbi:MAG: hypothetical protein NTX26_02005 [Candidatus Parcubacteria bacterium]|nr:hypothetical protein [Candidatus Parcubacteria bacterium]
MAEQIDLTKGPNVIDYPPTTPGDRKDISEGLQKALDALLSPSSTKPDESDLDESEQEQPKDSFPASEK